LVLNRPQNSIESSTFRHFRIARPQDPFNDPAGITPGVDDELFEETDGVFGNLVFAEGGGGDSGDVLIEEA